MKLSDHNRNELIDIILKSRTEKYLDGDINSASIEDLRKVASITHVGEKGMTGLAKFFFFFGIILFGTFIVSLFRTHWMQSIVELAIAIFAFGTSSFLHVRKGKKLIVDVNVKSTEFLKMFEVSILKLQKGRLFCYAIKQNRLKFITFLI